MVSCWYKRLYQSDCPDEWTPIYYEIFTIRYNVTVESRRRTNSSVVASAWLLLIIRDPENAETRPAALPHVPTVAKFVSGYKASFWTGVAAPKGTPAEIVDKVNKAVAPNVKVRDEWGATALPDDFAKFVAEETEKWGKVVKFAGIKAQ